MSAPLKQTTMSFCNRRPALGRGRRRRSQQTERLFFCISRFIRPSREARPWPFLGFTTKIKVEDARRISSGGSPLEFLMALLRLVYLQVKMTKKKGNYVYSDKYGNRGKRAYRREERIRDKGRHCANVEYVCHTNYR